MYNKHMHSASSATLPTRFDEDIQRVFLKCKRWQLEDTLDPINCQYHYYCNSDYPGDYPIWVDYQVMFFIAVSFLATIIVMVAGMAVGRKGNRQTKFDQLRRYILPSGPVFLPVILVIMAKGYRIDTVFPLSHTGPAILQLVRISALSFDTITESDIKYVFLEVSTISGILHAALYLDSIILPYYTGLDALISSRFSGECLSCVCRQQVLVVGGKLVYRGWSVTTALVVGVLICRIFTRLVTESKRSTMLMRFTIESLCWVLITVESLYLLLISPPDRAWTRAASLSGVFLLISLQLLRKLIIFIVAFSQSNEENKGRY